MKGLIIDIYCCGDGCTNGISKDAKGLTIVNIDGPFVASSEYPAAKIVERMEGYLVIEPILIHPHEPYTHTFSASGNIGYSSDSRFRAISKYSLIIHDRYEPFHLYPDIRRY